MQSSQIQSLSCHGGNWPRWLPQQVLQLMGPGSPVLGPGDKFGCRHCTVGTGVLGADKRQVLLGWVCVVSTQTELLLKISPKRFSKLLATDQMLPKLSGVGGIAGSHELRSSRSFFSFFGSHLGEKSALCPHPP